jgi:hypothetical protein
MTRPKRPAWEVSVSHVGYMVLVFPLAAGAALIVWKLSIWKAISQTIGLVAFLITFIVFAAVFYSILEWVFWNRPDEIRKRIPTSGKELRRQQKEFFDNLPK